MGEDNPEFRMATCTTSRASCTTASGSSTMKKLGNPRRNVDLDFDQRAIHPDDLYKDPQRSETKISEQPVGFSAGNVFDVAPTEGKPLPLRPRRLAHLLLGDTVNYPDPLQPTLVAGGHSEAFLLVDLQGLLVLWSLVVDVLPT